MAKRGNIYYTKKDFTDAEVQQKFRYPLILILHDNNSVIKKITAYDENGNKSIFIGGGNLQSVLESGNEATIGYKIISTFGGSRWVTGTTNGMFYSQQEVNGVATNYVQVSPQMISFYKSGNNTYINPNSNLNKTINLELPKESGTIATIQDITNAISNLKDNTLEFPTFADFPQPGEVGNIYIDLEADKIYIWDSASGTYISQSWNQLVITGIQSQISALQNFNSGLLAGTNRPLLSRSSYSLISELDSNGWPKQMAWVSHQNKRVNIADVETGQTHSTLDSRDLITHGVSNALIQYVTKIYDNGNRNINAGVFVSMAMNVVWYPLPRLVTLRFTIDQAYNIAEAKAYKLKINNTTSSAQVILDLANATTVNGNELVITFLDNALMEHTTELQEFEIYKDGQDDSGIPTFNWQKANLQPRLEVITISANTTLSEIHNNKMLHVINSVTITYPVGLLKDFNFVMKAFGNIAVQHVASSGVTLNAADGTYLKNGAMGSVYAISDNNLVLTGGFTTS